MENIIGAVILFNLLGFMALLVYSPFYCHSQK